MNPAATPILARLWGATGGYHNPKGSPMVKPVGKGGKRRGPRTQAAARLGVGSYKGVK